MRRLLALQHGLVTLATPCAVLLALAGCRDSNLSPPPTGRANPAGTRLDCIADVRLASVTCRPAASLWQGSSNPSALRPSYSLILGGQGTYVQVTSSNVSYSSGTQTFSADVSIQNLTAQQLGTPDGSTTTGVSLFISDGPTVTDGSGSVSVSNADGTGTFTASNQPYFLYSEMLDAFGGQSATKTWRFNVPTSVGTFTFSILIQAAAPDEAGVLRWVTESGSSVLSSSIWGADAQHVYACSVGMCFRNTPNGWASMPGTMLSDSLGIAQIFLAMHGTGPDDAWAVGAGGGIAHWDGKRWSSMPTPTSQQLNGVFARTPTDVWAVGIVSGAVFHYDGTSWTKVFTAPTTGPNTVSGLWTPYALSANDVWITGRGTPPATINGVSQPSARLLHWDGTTWTVSPYTQYGQFKGLYVHTDNDMWIGTIGGDTSIYHYDGATFTPVVLAPGASQVRALSAISPTDIWTATELDPDGRSTLAHYDGSTWSVVGRYVPVGQIILSMYAAADNDVYITNWSAGVPYHYDGSSITSASSPNSNASLFAGWAASATNVYAVGVRGVIQHTTGNGWALEASGTIASLQSIWGSGPTDVWADGGAGTILHGDGSTWSPSASGTTRQLWGIWGNSANSVWAVGDTGTILHYDGTSWSAQSSGTTVSLRAVSGTSASDVWAVGQTGILLHYNGSSWSSTPGGASTMFFLGVYAAASNDVWAVGQSSAITSELTPVMLHWNGSVWSAFTSPAGAAPFSCITGTGSTNVWAGNTNSMFHWNGTNWSRVPMGIPSAVCPVLASTDVYGVASGNGGGGFIIHGSR